MGYCLRGFLRRSVLVTLAGLGLFCSGGTAFAQQALSDRADTPTTGSLDPGCLIALSAPAPDTLLMVISPRMVYSMLEWPRMQTLAQSAGFHVVTWRAQGISTDEWRHAADRAGWTSGLSATIGEVPPACTALMGTVNHFPYSLVVAREMYHTWPIWGVLSDEAWLNALLFRRQALAAIHTPVHGPTR